MSKIGFKEFREDLDIISIIPYGLGRRRDTRKSRIYIVWGEGGEEGTQGRVGYL